MFKAIRKVKKAGAVKGYRVIAKSTGKPLSKKPLSHVKAVAQLRAVEFHRHNPGQV